MLTPKRFFRIALTLVAVCLWGLSAVAAAHTNGLALVSINGLDAIESGNPYSTSDQAPELYKPHQVLTFAINKAALSVPVDSEFQWVWGDDTPVSEGKVAKHQYAAPGTYLVKIQARSPGEKDFVKLNTIEVVLKQSPRTTANLLLLGGAIVGVVSLIIGIRWAHKRRMLH